MAAVDTACAGHILAGDDCIPAAVAAAQSHTPPMPHLKYCCSTPHAPHPPILAVDAAHSALLHPACADGWKRACHCDASERHCDVNESHCDVNEGHCDASESLRAGSDLTEAAGPEGCVRGFVLLASAMVDCCVAERPEIAALLSAALSVGCGNALSHESAHEMIGCANAQSVQGKGGCVSALSGHERHDGCASGAILAQSLGGACGSAAADLLTTAADLTTADLTAAADLSREQSAWTGRVLGALRNEKDAE